MRNFCTLFDSSEYFIKGMALYESLVRHCSEEFTLHILPLNDECAARLIHMHLPHVRMVLGFHETYPGMKEARANRTWQEYAWTCASSLCEALLNTGSEDVTYIDSDVWLFSSLEPMFQEIGNRSIGITPHQFPENAQKARLSKNGAYNVGVISFKATEDGKACASKWAADCRAWCYARNEDGKFADQGYLDFFERDFGSEVCSIQNIGVNAGPWNLQAYKVSERNGEVYLDDTRLIAFHYHEYLHGKRMTNYPLRPEDIDLIYKPYMAAYGKVKASLARVHVQS